MFTPTEREMRKDGATEYEIEAARKSFDQMVKMAKSSMVTFQEKEDGKGSRNDRVVWMLRHILNGDLTDEASRNHFVSQLKHYFGIPTSGFASYRFDRQPVNVVLRDFKNIEDKWKDDLSEKQRMISLEESDSILLDFKNGWAWIKLDRTSCSVEAKAMGHCGNEGGNDSDRILSLREKIANPDKSSPVKHLWRPHATFILSEDGYLGEMKGRFNNKPSADLHPYIIALLEQPYIRGITGGGYDPTKNFSLGDLTDDQARPLIEKLEISADEILNMCITKPGSEITEEALYQAQQNNIDMSIETEHGTFLLPYEEEIGTRVYHQYVPNTYDDMEKLYLSEKQVFGLLFENERIPIQYNGYTLYLISLEILSPDDDDLSPPDFDDYEDPLAAMIMANKMLARYSDETEVWVVSDSESYGIKYAYEIYMGYRSPDFTIQTPHGEEPLVS